MNIGDDYYAEAKSMRNLGLRVSIKWGIKWAIKCGQCRLCGSEPSQLLQFPDPRIDLPARHLRGARQTKPFAAEGRHHAAINRTVNHLKYFVLTPCRLVPLRGKRG